MIKMTTKETIRGFAMFMLAGLVVSILGVLLLIKGIDSLVTNDCGGAYPNPNIGGCGIYSQNDLDRKWCEDKGGHFFRVGFTSYNCTFPK